VLSILNAVHAHAAGSLNLATQVTLIVDDALHAHFASAALDAVETPQGAFSLLKLNRASMQLRRSLEFTK
jgi:hypothetical protein